MGANDHFGNSVQHYHGTLGTNLKTRKVRNADMLLIPGIYESHPTTTTIKSSQFQPSRRYDPSSIMKPSAITLIIISIVKATYQVAHFLWGQDHFHSALPVRGAVHISSRHFLPLGAHRTTGATTYCWFREEQN